MPGLCDWCEATRINPFRPTISENNKNDDDDGAGLNVLRNNKKAQELYLYSGLPDLRTMTLARPVPPSGKSGRS